MVRQPSGAPVPPRPTIGTRPRSPVRPICYEQHYAGDNEHQRCLQRSATCYPNAGLYLGTSTSLARWMAAKNATWQSFLGTPMSAAECQADQAVVHLVNRDFTALAGLYVRLGFLPE